MKRSIRSAMAVTMLVVVTAACSSDSKEPTTTTVPKTTTTAEVPSPVATVLATYVNADPLLRFAMEISNPGSRTLVGVETLWKALDANGVIVGSVENRSAPPIPPGGSILDAGGAGGVLLKGTPASVKVEITKTGQFVDVEPDPTVQVDGVPTFKRAEFDFHPGGRDYDVSVTVAALTEVNSSDLSVPVVLRDAAGAVIGSDFGHTDDLPSRLAPGEKVVVTASVTVANGEPATVQASAYT